ncbi:hypothetical protein pb186bvf_010188 [Paramecium bursaria]
MQLYIAKIIIFLIILRSHFKQLYYKSIYWNKWKDQMKSIYQAILMNIKENLNIYILKIIFNNKTTSVLIKFLEKKSMLKFQSKSKLNGIIKETSQSFDLFAQPPQLRILKKNKFNTTIGHVLTLAMMALGIVYLFFSIKDMINQNSPSVVYTEYQVLDSEPIYLSKENFTFALTLANLSLTPLSTFNKDYQLYIQNCQRKRNVDPVTGAFVNITTKCVPYAVETCNMEKHFITQQQKEFFKNINLNSMYCPSSEQWDERPLVIQGTTAGNNYQYITVMATECKNGTNPNITCNPKDQINKGLQAGYYAVYISDYLNQLNIAGNPFKQIIQLAFSTFSITTSKEIFLQYKYTQTKTDEGLILPDYQTEFAIIQQTTTQNQNLYNSQYILYHTICLDFKSGTYDRSYPKLQEILGSLGGLWQVMYIITQIVIAPIVTTMMNLQMANKIFSFVLPQDPNEVIEQQMTIKQIQGSDHNVAFQSAPLSSRDLLQSQRPKTKGKNFSIFKGRGDPKNQPTKINDTKEMKSFVKKRNKSLLLSFKEIILILCGCRQQEKQLIDYASNKILSKLDVAFILKKLFELEKMKQLLFNEEQLKLFQYLPKPSIPLNLFDKGNEGKLKELESVQQFQFILSEEKSDVMKITEAYQAYLSIKSQDQSRIDNLLIQQLDEDILDLFKCIENGNKRLESLVSVKVIDHVFDDSGRGPEDLEEGMHIALPSPINQE